MFGNGKTSVKVSIGKYLAAADGSSITGALTNPLSRISTSVTRTWTDGNKNFKPDCDLSNPLAQDLRASGGDFCGQISNLNFAKPVFSNTYDPAILNGWGLRPYDWNIGVQVQQELLPRVSVNVGYFRRWFGNFLATDNLAVKASDYSTFSITAARRFAAARRRWQRDFRPLRCRADAVRSDEQLHHACGQLRQPDVALEQRRSRTSPRASARG